MTAGESSPVPQCVGWRLLLFGALLVSAPVHAYRPFSSTDADVADAGELETEFGYFTVEHSAGEETFILPQLVFNYGLTSTLEIIGEFDVEKPAGKTAEIVDAAVLLKGLLRQGVLHPLPFPSENILGAIALRSQASEADLATLGMELRGAEESLELLFDTDGNRGTS